MSNAIPARPRMMQSRRTNVGIVASQYNPQYVDGLTSHCLRELGVLLPESPVLQYTAPGAFEIPLVVQEIADRGQCSAIIALGVIIKGETAHADLIGEAVTRALLDMSLRVKVPVIHEVLLLDNEDQARVRCIEEEINRGTEAARVAVRMIQILADLRGRTGA